MKKLLFIFSISLLLIFSCSSGDDEISEKECLTFLECYGSTDWKWEDGHGYLIYYKFNNTLSNPFTIYYYNDHDFTQPCLQVINISDFNFNITENSKEKLVVQQYVSNGDYAFYTFELNNGVMSLSEVSYEDNEIDYDDYYILFKEAVNSKIPICK